VFEFESAARQFLSGIQNTLGFRRHNKTKTKHNPIG